MSEWVLNYTGAIHGKDCKYANGVEWEWAEDLDRATLERMLAQVEPTGRWFRFCKFCDKNTVKREEQERQALIEQLREAQRETS